jgi:cyclopropane fatty-acyl-phospholipid synthase-like methyltransferase
MSVLTQDRTTTVARCYALLDASIVAGIEDFSEGKYGVADANDAEGYADAQWRQAEYLLDQIRCESRSRILDIGCGNGRLLRQAEERGASAVGITIANAQVRRCRARRLDARLIDYRDLQPDIHGRFSGIVANGALEHFVQPTDAAEGLDDRIYRDFFRTCRRMIRRGDRLVTTAIHFRERGQVDPNAIVAGSKAHRTGTPEYHFAAVLQDCFGGWYPAPRQLQHAARNRFVLEREENGTRDYARTSAYWLRRLRLSLATRPDVLMQLAGKLSTQFMPTLRMLRCLMVDRSWNWQFEGDEPPTRLLRQTWRAI